MRAEVVTTLKRKATELLTEIEGTRAPILITKHGLPSAYLVDAVTYEFDQRKMAILDGIARGERAAAEGRVLSHEEVVERMSKWRK